MVESKKKRNQSFLIQTMMMMKKGGGRWLLIRKTAIRKYRREYKVPKHIAIYDILKWSGDTNSKIYDDTDENSEPEPNYTYQKLS